jgi:hypothetical protein
MKNVVKIRIAASALLLTIGSIASGQAVPAGGGNTPISAIGSSPNPFALDGTLHYALNASEVIQFGYNGSGQVVNSTALSADVSYTGKSTVYPFSALFAGGVILPNQQEQGTTSFWNVAVSQGLVTRTWSLNVSDSFSFLPQSPTTGLSGIPGVGDLGPLPVQGPVAGPAGGIFSFAGDRIDNSLSGSAERQFTSAMSISGSGSWSILNFLDNNGSSANGGLDSSWVAGSVALNRRLDGRSSASIDAVYSTITYSGDGSGLGTPDIEIKGINGSYQRVLSRRLSMSVSAGPQWVSSSNSTLIPSKLNVAASASLTYSRGFTSVGVSYLRGVNAGSGVLPGALSDTIAGSVGRTFGRKWVASLAGGYTRSSGLTQLFNQGSIVPTNAVYDSVYVGAQLTRGFGTHFSGFASYTVQDQTSSTSLAGQNALNGTSQTLGIGISYTPRSTRLGQF